MADEVFALSPIAARAVQPSEEDYDAINHAFMETSRGRWFLGEYAKRNRNADTRMVLDAVARIEQTLTDQRPPVPDNQLADALAAISGAVDEARAASASAIDGVAVEEHLAPVRKGIRVIKEISWRWREIGADGRICDLIDSQLGAIEAACEQISSADPREALGAAFDLIRRRIAEFGEDDGAAADAAEDAKATATPAASSSAFPSETIPATAEAAMPEQAGAIDGGAGTSIPDLAAEPNPVATVEAADGTVEAAGVPAEAADAAVEAAEISTEAADAYDEAVLDMVALEMGAPDASDVDHPSDLDDASGSEHDGMDSAASPNGDPIIVAQPPEPAAIQSAVQPSPEPQAQPSPQTSLEPSLGSSLIASGIVRGPQPLKADPLAPIRRMSQAEKIAFFS
jgi:hypothetical protein